MQAERERETQRYIIVLINFTRELIGIFGRFSSIAPRSIDSYYFINEPEFLIICENGHYFDFALM